ncbi:aminopeptidase [Desulfovibrio sp. TomC]|uniref:aminopeptidase n=1 Tax=Desulfovibrio sp. TomC TaxID=1562888 RepID=UPI0005759C02|nr:aminopeptidase [Desulfovibrio sp. TomC]KHK04057.1 Aminopeptidase S (Leu, Val, Phe, Tyr preference) [Desulfovibrio sp. TomC]
MLTRPQLEKYADVLVWGLTTSRTEPYKPGDVILVQYELAALKLAEAVYAKLLARGLNPVPRLALTPTMETAFYATADEAQLVFQAPGQVELNENLHGAMHLLAPDSLMHLSGIDPKRIATAALARKPLRDILVGREEKGEFGWTLCLYPTAELAGKAGMTKKEYAAQVVSACFLKDADPVGRWRKLYDEAREIKAWLGSLAAEYLHVESDNVDLKVTPGARRRWLGLSGHNIPSFEIFTSPDWRGTSGRYYADQPSYRSGNLVRGVRLTFADGQVTEIAAEQGESFVRKQLAMDPGASRLGEFSLTDRRFSRIDRFMANTLYDENFGGPNGNCHVAVGSSYSDTYAGDPSGLDAAKKAALGFNDSALHWDLVNTEAKRVRAHLADGSDVTIYENGQFAY